jgi:hypothetical protein
MNSAPAISPAARPGRSVELPSKILARVIADESMVRAPEWAHRPPEHHPSAATASDIAASLNDRALNVESGDGCSDPQVIGEVMDLTLE